MDDEAGHQAPQQPYNVHNEDDAADECLQLQSQFQHECNIDISKSSSICEIEEEEEYYGEGSSSHSIGSSSIPIEIRELFEGNRYLPMPSIKEEQNSSSPYFNGDNNTMDCVYVAVGNSESSMDALQYAVKQLLRSSSSGTNANSTALYLIHIFPEIKCIPSPLGKLPKSQVSPEQVESYITKEAGKRRQLLQKYLDTCSAANVTVDALLIESNMIAKAIVNLIPILNIRKLVLGTSKSNSRKLMSGKSGGSGIADQVLGVLQSVPQELGCEIKIICQGNDVMFNACNTEKEIIANACSDDHTNKPNAIESSTLSPRAYDDQTSPTSVQDDVDRRRNEAFSFLCFKSNCHGG